MFKRKPMSGVLVVMTCALLVSCLYSRGTVEPTYVTYGDGEVLFIDEAKGEFPDEPAELPYIFVNKTRDSYEYVGFAEGEVKVPDGTTELPLVFSNGKISVFSEETPEVTKLPMSVLQEQ